MAERVVVSELVCAVGDEARVVAVDVRDHRKITVLEGAAALAWIALTGNRTVTESVAWLVNDRNVEISAAEAMMEDAVGAFVDAELMQLRAEA